MPGDPIDLLASGDPNVTSEDIARLKALHGLDQPLYKRYWHWFEDAVQGRLRLFANACAAGARGAAAAARQHLPAHGHQPAARLRARAAGRRARRAQAALLVRLHAQPVRLRRDLDAVVLAGAAADPAVRGRARLAAGGRRADGRGRPVRRSRGAPGAAGPHADRAHCRRSAAVHPRGHDRGAAPGLHPHRARQGPGTRTAWWSGTRCATP